MRRHTTTPLITITPRRAGIDHGFMSVEPGPSGLIPTTYTTTASTIAVGVGMGAIAAITEIAVTTGIADITGTGTIIVNGETGAAGAAEMVTIGIVAVGIMTAIITGGKRSDALMCCCVQE